MAFRKPRKRKDLQESWEALLKKYPTKSDSSSRKLTTRSSKAPLTLVLKTPPGREIKPYPGPTQPLLSKPLKTVLFAGSEEELNLRETAAREVKHCIMPGHKQGYEVVTDPALISQMGKKTA